MGSQERLGRYILRNWWVELAVGAVVILAVFWMIAQVDQVDTRTALFTSAAAIVGALAVIGGGLMVEQYRNEEEQTRRTEDDRKWRQARFEQMQWDSLLELDEWTLSSMDISMQAFGYVARGDRSRSNFRSDSCMQTKDHWCFGSDSTTRKSPVRC